MTRSSYWYQDSFPCDLDNLWNWPLSGAFVFHKHIFHIAHEHFFWQDLPTGIKIFVLVTLTIFGIGHYRGHLCFTNTSCLISVINLCNHLKFLCSEGNLQKKCLLIFFFYNTLVYIQTETSLHENVVISPTQSIICITTSFFSRNINKTYVYVDVILFLI